MSKLHILCLCLFMFFFGQLLEGQNLSVGDPMQDIRELVGENEMVLLWNERGNSVPNQTRTAIYDLNYGGTPNWAPVANGRWDRTSTSVNASLGRRAYGKGGLDAAAGPIFAGNSSSQFIRNGLVQAWITQNADGDPQAALEVSMPGRYSQIRHTIYPGFRLFPANDHYTPKVKVSVGNFIGDEQAEIALLYTNRTGKTHLFIFEAKLSCVAGDCRVIITEVASNTYSMVSPDLTQGGTNYINLSDMAVGDLDADGYDEIVVGTTWGTRHRLRLHVFAVENRGNNGIIEKSVTASFGDYFSSYCPIFNQANSSSHDRFTVGVAVGDFDPILPGKEVAVAALWGLGEGNPGANRGLYFTFYRWDTTQPAGGLITNYCNGNTELFYDSDQQLGLETLHQLDLEAGDTDGDYRDEAVLLVNGVVKVFEANFSNTAAPIYKEEQSFSTSLVNPDGSHVGAALAVGNIDNLLQSDPLDGEVLIRDEIVVAENLFVRNETNNTAKQEFNLRTYTIQANGTPTLRFENKAMFEVNDESERRDYAIVLADLDGNSLSLGTPSVRQVNKVLSPSVILNAPPVHFDVFEDGIRDLSGIYPSANPSAATLNNFKATYTAGSTEETSLSTSFNSDWSVSAKVEGSAQIKFFNVGAKVENTYGEGFEKVEGNSFKTELSQSITAQLDDRILAYSVNYKVYEYPVLVGDEIVQYLLVTLLDGQPSPASIDARTTQGYRPEHQPGNLFSYPKTLPSNNSLSYKSGTGFDGNQVTNSGGLGNFTYRTTEINTNSFSKSYSNSTTVGVNAGVGFKKVGLNVDVEGTYSFGGISTQSSSIGTQVEIVGTYGSGNQPGFAFQYTPGARISWDPSGALSLNHAVQLNNEAFNTFFSNRYNGYDPAFLLPFIHDPEKGLVDINDVDYIESNRFLTREILHLRGAENEPDTLYARVHNYAFNDAPAGVEVCFYIYEPGDPNPISRLGCTNLTETLLGRTNGFEPQLARFIWFNENPPSSQASIVAVIDPENKLDNEIHDWPNGNGITNNLGWSCYNGLDCPFPDLAILQTISQGVTGVINPNIAVQEELKVYPNPNRGTLWLEVPTTQANSGSVYLFDMHGRLLFERRLSSLYAGQSLQLDIDDLPKGVYRMVFKTDDIQLGARVVRQ